MRKYSAKSNLRTALESLSMALFWVAVILLPLKNYALSSGLLVGFGVLFAISRTVKVTNVFRIK